MLPGLKVENEQFYSNQTIQLKVLCLLTYNAVANSHSKGRKGHYF